jgi:hypothetical protein
LLDGHFVRRIAETKLYGLKNTGNKIILRKLHNGELYDSYLTTNIILEIYHVQERREIHSNL